MEQRLKAAARMVIAVISSLAAEANRLVSGWVNSGDVTLIVIISVVALILLFIIVVPKRRGY